MFKFLRGLFSNDISIDLGTANTLIYTKEHGIVLDEPSVVAIQEKNGQKTVVAVGHDAKKMLGRTPGKMDAIRPLRDGVIADFNVCEKMLQHFIKKVSNNSIMSPSPRVLICVPSKATQVEKRAIRESALSAGASVVKLIEEPIAAALGAGVAIDKARGSMVVDVGGGTSEVAILSLNGIVYSESLKVGGDKFDEAIQTYVRRKFGVVIGESTAELIKLQVGCATLNCKKEFDPYEFRGRNLAEGIPELVVFKKEDGFGALENQCNAIVRSIRSALELSPPELAADISQDGIVLTGGGALLHCLDTLIEQSTGIPTRVSEDPLTCVARGGGIALGLMDKDFDLFAEE